MICRHNNILILIAVILFNGCGIYSFKGSLPPNIKTIYISPVINSSSEYALSNMLNEQINEQLVKKNILKIEEFYNSDSKLDISIQLVEDIPNSYTSNINSYEVIEQWKLNARVSITWLDNLNNNTILDKVFTEWAMYDNSGLDISSDGIDNDSDGLIDAEDSDEYGPSRQAALRIIANNTVDRIIEELISNW
ncbi:MAG: hypothetical protein CMG66_00510 [Candidatus Marinimicrobia bacterium]|nr:hypothetical protein [Candidatus Neomarinimicrobiota bacterium]|tara:strand:- start:20008 stop:20586 length:579 start_codon:yes stop_codon:yes gene_type:complete